METVYHIIMGILIIMAIYWLILDSYYEEQLLFYEANGNVKFSIALNVLLIFFMLFTFNYMTEGVIIPIRFEYIASFPVILFVFHKRLDAEAKLMYNKRKAILELHGHKKNES